MVEEGRWEAQVSLLPLITYTRRTRCRQELDRLVAECYFFLLELRMYTNSPSALLA
jgi:hypothetical protein